MSSAQFMHPRERLRFFLSVVEPKGDNSASVREVVEASIQEWQDLAGKLLEKPLLNRVISKEFVHHLERNEVEAFDFLSMDDVLKITQAYDIEGHRQDLSAQFLIDGLDVWLNQQDIHRVSTMLTAIGVQPALVKEAAAKSRDRLNDFLITLLFPERSDRESHGDFLASLHAMHAAPAVEDYNPTPPPGSPLPQGANATGGIDMHVSRNKRNREDGLPGAQSDASIPSAFMKNGDLLITPETLPELLSKRPDLLPKDVLHANRAPIQHGISEFALLNHYTMPELREFVSSNSVPDGKKQTKADIVRAILAYLESLAQNDGAE